MLKHMRTAIVAALGGVALGATLFGGVPALAAGGGFGRANLQADLAQAASAQDRACAGYVDADGDGVCDACAAGAGCRNGAGYIDADGDGICDNYGTGAGGGHHGHHARGHHGGHGRC